MQSALAASVRRLANEPPAAASGPSQPGLPPGAQASSVWQDFFVTAAALSAGTGAGAVPGAAAPSLPGGTVPLLPTASGSLAAEDELLEEAEAKSNFRNVYRIKSAKNLSWRPQIDHMGKTLGFGAYASKVAAAIGADVGKLWAGLRSSAPLVLGGNNQLAPMLTGAMTALQRALAALVLPHASAARPAAHAPLASHLSSKPSVFRLPLCRRGVR